MNRYGITDCAIEKLYVVPATSCIVPVSVIEKRVTVEGKLRYRRTVVEAPAARLPMSRGNGESAVL